MRLLDAARKTRAQDPPDEQGRLHHRLHLRGRISRRCPVLPDGQRCLATTPTALDLGSVDAENPGSKPPLVEGKDAPPLQGDHRYPARATHLLPGQPRTT